MDDTQEILRALRRAETKLDRITRWIHGSDTPDGDRGADFLLRTLHEEHQRNKAREEMRHKTFVGMLATTLAAVGASAASWFIGRGG